MKVQLVVGFMLLHMGMYAGEDAQKSQEAQKKECAEHDNTGINEEILAVCLNNIQRAPQGTYTRHYTESPVSPRTGQHIRNNLPGIAQIINKEQPGIAQNIRDTAYPAHGKIPLSPALNSLRAIKEAAGRIPKSNMPPFILDSDDCKVRSFHGTGGYHD